MSDELTGIVDQRNIPVVHRDSIKPFIKHFKPASYIIYRLKPADSYDRVRC